MIPRHGRTTADATTISRREGRVFALTLAGGFLFVTAVAYWRAWPAVAYAAAALAAVSVLAALVIPGRLGPARRSWKKLGELIGRVTTPVLMAIVYYLVVTPLALARKVASRRAKGMSDSGWHRRPPLPPRERMERQF